MAASLGIGVTTYNRLDRLLVTLEHLRRHTRTPHVLIVADDGSTDGTVDALRRLRLPHVAGPNRGVAWNKNRALYYLHAVRRVATVILIEDDTYPQADGWERDWMEAARRWGHANFAGHWVSPWFQSGTGTLDDPVLSEMVPGVCSSFSREALDAVGYMDTLFRKYGFEHGEHTRRLLRLGYGGVAEPLGHYLIGSPLGLMDLFADLHQDALPENRIIYQHLVDEPQTFRRAWRTRAERKALFAELLAARLHDPAGWLAVRLHVARAEAQRVFASLARRRRGSGDPGEA